MNFNTFLLCIIGIVLIAWSNNLAHGFDISVAEYPPCVGEATDCSEIHIYTIRAVPLN